MPYRFKKEFSDAVIAIPGRKGLITSESLTDADAKLLLKLEHLAHNIEEVPAEEMEVEAPAEEVEAPAEVEEADTIVSPASSEKKKGSKK